MLYLAELLGKAEVHVVGRVRADPGVLVLLVVPGEELGAHARASSMDPKCPPVRQPSGAHELLRTRILGGLINEYRYAA
ncbi:hypothetical protein [Streptomyces sp. NPDC050388]|uniref:hypothetical protein n=1 Tax=Streptomyces sp. NPDC050388 TaxID=3155781 RepID=UPI0034455151